MIVIVEKEIDGRIYDRCLEISDWRFSATAVGLIRYLDFHGFAYYVEGRKLFYNFEEVDLSLPEMEEKYFLFAEDWFKELMHHRILMGMYRKENLSEDDKKLINEKFAANEVMKEVFSGIRYGDLDADSVEKKIVDNRFKIIKKTFLNAKKGYSKFGNLSCFGKSNQEICRLLGFYVDTGRKTKSLGYNFNKNTRNVLDCIEFDYIPFAFTKGWSSIFINSNTSVNALVKVNDSVEDYYKNLADKNATWNTIFYDYLSGSKYLRQNVEIILKANETDYYETVFVREKSIEIFLELMEGKENVDQLTNLEKMLKASPEINSNYYLNMEEIVTNAILNQVVLDEVIEKLLKLDNNKKEKKPYRWIFCIKQLVRVNVVLYKKIKKWEGEMVTEKYLYGAHKSAMEVNQYFKKKKLENKVNGYRQRLTSCMVAKDYDRFFEIMLQLSSYTDNMKFPFLHQLLKDFEGNKNLAYEFIHSLGDSKDNKNNNEKKEGENNEE